MSNRLLLEVARVAIQGWIATGPAEVVDQSEACAQAYLEALARLTSRETACDACDRIAIEIAAMKGVP